MFDGAAGITTRGDTDKDTEETPVDRLLTWSLLWICPWESGAHDNTEEDESYGQERGGSGSCLDSGFLSCSLPAANLSGQH